MTSKLKRDLLPMALVSVWEEATEEGRLMLREYFQRIILSIVVDGADCMDHAWFALSDPFTTGKVAEQCQVVGRR
jgi:hypothetical protein